MAEVERKRFHRPRMPDRNDGGRRVGVDIGRAKGQPEVDPRSACHATGIRMMRTHASGIRDHSGVDAGLA